ncbi:hypothetical protein ACFWY5_53460 [Nonomuraea sp. NPDC059007]|uniref:hypothetical protein n=1 Tax=Nonomuraea sp. NPDC059007 TaxID=3346692 RepID=UPI003694A569
MTSLPTLATRALGAQAAAEIGAAAAIFQREMLLFTRERLRLALLLVQPVLLLTVMGVGLTNVIPSDRIGGQYLLFLFPGVLVMTVVTPPSRSAPRSSPTASAASCTRCCWPPSAGKAC